MASRSFLDQMREIHGAESPWWRSNILGLFPGQESVRFLPAAWLDACTPAWGVGEWGSGGVGDCRPLFDSDSPVPPLLDLWRDYPAGPVGRGGWGRPLGDRGAQRQADPGDLRLGVARRAGRGPAPARAGGGGAGAEVRRVGGSCDLRQGGPGALLRQLPGQLRAGRGGGLL